MDLDPAEYNVSITSDRMEASITLLKEDASSKITVESLRKALAASGVVAGILDDQLSELASTPSFQQPYVIARGKLGTDGTHDIVEHKFPTDEKIQLEETETGSINFRNIGNFSNFRKGDILSTKTPATQGISGVNVHGEEMKGRDGKTIALKVGKGAELSEDGMAVIAQLDGHACLVADRITVVNTVEVPSHVDYSVGNIKFIANVHIRGSVRPDFKVEAEGNIEITGNVEKALIKCGGNLTIHGNIFGQGATKITVGGDASIGAIDQAEVSVRGNLSVKNYIRHTDVSCGGTIEVTGQKGNIVGGDVHAYRGITAPFIGNSMAALTKLTVGTNPFISHELEEIQSQHDTLKEKLTQVLTAMSKLTDRRVATTGALDPANQTLLDKLQAARIQLEPQIKTLSTQLEQVMEKSTNYKDATIRVSDIIYSGVLISFRDRMQYKTQDELQHIVFYEEEAEIRNRPF